MKYRILKLENLASRLVLLVVILLFVLALSIAVVDHHHLVAIMAAVLQLNPSFLPNWVFWLSIATVVGLIVVVFVHFYDVIFGLNQRLLELKKETRRIADGDFFTPIELDGEDELSELGQSMDEMQTALRGTIEELSRVSADFRRYEFIVNTSRDFMTLIDSDYRYEAANESYCRAHQTTQSAIIGKTLGEVWGEDRFEKYIKHFFDQALSGQEVNYQQTFEFHKLGERYMDVTYFPFYGTDERVTHIVVVSRDTTAHKQLELQFLQAQKMEVVGKLAGGIAHDFNNLLTVILGNTQFLRKNMKPTAEMLEVLDDIYEGARSATGLTQQLLSFSRKQVTQFEWVRLDDVITKMGTMIKRVLGEKVELELIKGPDVPRIYADAIQLEQIVMNMAFNCKDAVDTGGELKISTSVRELKRDMVHRFGVVKSGNYVSLQFTDDGSGMEEEVLDQIFEPFFTTKKVGKGTGLGLATVFGIVQQHDAFITCESILGEGTTFTVYFPLDRANGDGEQMQVSGTDESTTNEDEDIQVNPGNYTVLVVEDEENVRVIAKRILEAGGYTILEAASGEEAIQICKDYKKEIHILFTDILMPGMTGPEAAEEIIALLPSITVVFTSGYMEDEVTKQGIRSSELQFIAKPYAHQDLLPKMRELLKS